MNAKKAREIALDNQLGTDKALENIAEAAARGETSFIFYAKPLSSNTIMELMKDYGYKLSVHVDPITGKENSKVDW